MTAPTLAVVAPLWSPTAWLVGAALVAVLAAVTVICVVRARRLDRLHRRTDAARAGLADALDRRGGVALRVADALAAAPPPPPRGDRWSSGRAPGRPHGSMRRADDAATALRTVARAALAACRVDLRASGAGLEPCEVAENTLTRRLAAVDPAALPAALAADLAEAEQLVVLARRVHNDAVRDTLDLRSRRLVRWLRLAGTAPVPAYFEIADPAPRRRADGGTRPRPAGRPAADDVGPAVSSLR